MIDWVHSIVTLSGTVSLNGTPASDATVSYDGVSTTADGSGNYVLHPFANSSGTLNVTDGLVSGSAPVIVGSQDQTANLDIPFSGSLVTVSGAVTTGSSPAANATVTYDGLSKTTDANGNYSFEVFPGTSGTMNIREGLLTASAPVTVGSSDETEDVNIPTSIVSGSVHVVNGLGDSMSGVQVQGSVTDLTSPVQGTTTDGSPVTWGLSQPVPNLLACTTDATGTCSFQALLNMTGALSASYPLVPGDSSYPTLTASVTETVPSDGFTVTLAFPNVVNVPSSGSSSGSVLVASQGSTVIANPTSTPVPSGVLPTGTSAPVGAIAYAVQSVPVGGSVDVFIQLPPGTNPTGVDKLQNGQLVDVSSLATISGNDITLHLTDGGPGDADGTANGTIEDPVVPVVGTAPSGGFAISTTSLPTAAPGAPYGPLQLHTTGSGPGATFKWKKAGPLPKGIKLVKTGVLAGTANKKLAAGSVSVPVQVTETVVTSVTVGSKVKQVKTKTTVSKTLTLRIS